MDEVTAAMQKSLVLIIANESPLRDALEAGLQRSGCSVITAHSAELAVQRATVYLPEVVVVGADMDDAGNRLLQLVERAHGAGRDAK